MWALNKDNSPAVDAHGKVIINWILSLLVYGVICFILTFVLIGALGFMILAALGIIFPIIGAVKANMENCGRIPCRSTSLNKRLTLLYSGTSSRDLIH